MLTLLNVGHPLRGENGSPVKEMEWIYTGYIIEWKCTLTNLSEFWKKYSS